MSGTVTVTLAADTPTTAVSPKGREVFEKAARYGIRHGFSIPVPTEAGPCVVVSPSP